jgi:V/A-type H+-transporting ATPase subunit I
MLVKMSKVEVIGPKKHFFDTVSLLHRLGTLHVEDVARGVGRTDVGVTPVREDSEHTGQISKLENLVARVDSIVGTLAAGAKTPTEEEREKAYKSVWKEDANELANEINELIAEVETKTRELADRKSSLEVENSILAKYEPVVEKIQPLTKHICTTEGFESVALLIDKKYKAGLTELRNELEKISKGQCEMVAEDVDENTTAAIIVFNKTYSKMIHEFLAFENVNQVRLPDEMAGQPFDTVYKQIKERRKEIPEELGKINKELKALADSWHLKLTAIGDALKDRLDQIRILPQLGETDYTFLITGWLPTDKVERARQALDSEFMGNVVINELTVSHKDMEEAPVVLSNRPWAKPFQLFYRFSKPPRYGTIDPTPFVALFFPLIFGMIVGDAGYGLAMMLLALVIKRKMKDSIFAQTLADILGIAATSAVVWGIVYFEFFGDIPLRILAWSGFLKHPSFHEFIEKVPHISFGKLLGQPFGFPMDRIESPVPLLIMTIVLGIVHIGIGLVFGMINSYREGEMKHLFERLGMFLIFCVSSFLGLLSFVASPFGWLAVVTLILGVGFTAYGGSIKGIIEIFGTLSNICSYARVMAIGLAGVGLALASNELAAGMGEVGGVVALIPGVMLAILLHTVNIVISAFSPSIHSLRLHLVESFTKFHEPAEVEYTPFHQRTGTQGESK